MPYARPDALVSTAWLASHLGAPDLRLIDASFKLPGVTPTAREDYLVQHIPGTVFFDIDEISDQMNPLPHMVPAPEKFSARMRRLGIGDGHKLVIYDSAGLGSLNSAARAWWMFRLFGHDDVAILNGGLSKWLAEQRPVTAEIPSLGERHFTARLNTLLIRDKPQMLANLSRPHEQVIDARSRARFAGSVDEPRRGLRRGHIPGSVNLPCDQLTDRSSNAFISAEMLAARFAQSGLDPDRPVVCTCGSGVTACTLAFGIHLLGWPDAAVYDGSWSEWGLANTDMPIETG